MYVIIAPIQVKEGHQGAFLEAVVEDARSSVHNEPGCLRFDVIQDANDPNRIWLYEVYQDEAAFQAHLQAPHLIKFGNHPGLGALKVPRGGRGSSNVWPPDASGSNSCRVPKRGSWYDVSIP